MQFKTIEQLVQLANQAKVPISEIMILEEMMAADCTREAVINRMQAHLDTMEQAVERGLTEDIRSHSGLTGGEGKKLHAYAAGGSTVSGRRMLNAVSRAIATNEVNAAMGTIIATPTAGACGVIPGCLFGLAPELGVSREEMVRFLFTSGAIGMVIANQSFISGAAGGCQAEVGSASAMAAGAVVELAGGTPEQSAEAVAIALKNTLGLVCDPVAGLVEVPCVMRNAMGAANALVAADLALAGVKSVIPADEVIAAMYRVGQAMPNTLKETAMGGLADTPTGRRIKDQLFGNPPPAAAIGEE
ncbi:L-serine ammonia-lyase, iron-sulfur-dependent, subunit alpha [Paenibacillus sp. YPG26]|uniref:L-serine ammonia-lyase, iron-sulfur-dependent, subunit alpha n=1 Tax=Paenibacillus sp. YPG26 TaxID=2878915 RepID=UPI00203CE972|nr:L-serine ammonia-lyase, iron-sulfur-dependent, subunit alpha [Paenibacillus sp. YPG26]USB31946.1 L-serine ammonia-lyase, iron-sulfur-dependent, subunit alpha [Paenibacillus sp. YPG26]